MSAAAPVPADEVDAAPTGTMSLMAPALPRPRQVTIAGWMVMACSVAVVLTVFQQIAGLHTLDTREAVQRLLDAPPFEGTGLSVDEVIGVVRVLSMVAAACATATAILGWHVLQRSKSSRVALTVLAVPLFVTGLGTGGLLSTAVLAAALLLWLQPARDWFDGRWQPAPPAPSSPTSGRTSAPPTSPPTSPPASPPGSGQEQPRPYAGWPPPQQSWPPPAATLPPPAAPRAAPPAAPSAAGTPVPSVGRPPAVVAAAVLTWVCSVLLGGLFVAGSLWLMASPDPLMDEMTRQHPELISDGSVTVDMVRAMLAVVASVIGLWVLTSCVAAVFVLRRAAWARIVLLVSSAVAALGLVALTVLNFAMVLPLVGAAGVVALLLRRDVSAWFSRPR